MSGSEEWIDPQEAGCRLLLRIAATDDASTLPDLAGLAGLVLAKGLDEPAAWQMAASQRGIACLIDGDIVQAKALGCDGVLLTEPLEIDVARTRLGADAIIGVRSPTQRHDAMLAGEAGADYVLVGSPDLAINDDLLELIDWWHTMTVLPITVAGMVDERQTQRAIDAGADFLLIDFARFDQLVQAGLDRQFA